MSRRAVFIERDVFASVFSALDLWDKIAAGRLSSIVVKELPARGNDPNLRTRYVEHHALDGGLVCTTHQLVSLTEEAPRYWSGSNIRFRDFTLAKQAFTSD